MGHDEPCDSKDNWNGFLSQMFSFSAASLLWLQKKHENTTTKTSSTNKFHVERARKNGTSSTEPSTSGVLPDEASEIAMLKQSGDKHDDSDSADSSKNNSLGLEASDADNTIPLESQPNTTGSIFDFYLQYGSLDDVRCSKNPSIPLETKKKLLENGVIVNGGPNIKSVRNSMSSVMLSNSEMDQHRAMFRSSLKKTVSSCERQPVSNTVLGMNTPEKVLLRQNDKLIEVTVSSLTPALDNATSDSVEGNKKLKRGGLAMTFVERDLSENVNQPMLQSNVHVETTVAESWDHLTGKKSMTVSLSTDKQPNQDDSITIIEPIRFSSELSLQSNKSLVIPKQERNCAFDSNRLLQQLRVTIKDMQNIEGHPEYFSSTNVKPVAMLNELELAAMTPSTSTTSAVVNVIEDAIATSTFGWRLKNARGNKFATSRDLVIGSAARIKDRPSSPSWKPNDMVEPRTPIHHSKPDKYSTEPPAKPTPKKISKEAAIKVLEQYGIMFDAKHRETVKHLPKKKSHLRVKSMTRGPTLDIVPETENDRSCMHLPAAMAPEPPTVPVPELSKTTVSEQSHVCRRMATDTSSLAIFDELQTLRVALQKISDDCGSTTNLDGPPSTPIKPVAVVATVDKLHTKEVSTRQARQRTSRSISEHNSIISSTSSRPSTVTSSCSRPATKAEAGQKKQSVTGKNKQIRGGTKQRNPDKPMGHRPYSSQSSMGQSRAIEGLKRQLRKGVTISQLIDDPVLDTIVGNARIRYPQPPIRRPESNLARTISVQTTATKYKSEKPYAAYLSPHPKETTKNQPLASFGKAVGRSKPKVTDEKLLLANKLIADGKLPKHSLPKTRQNSVIKQSTIQIAPVAKTPSIAYLTRTLPDAVLTLSDHICSVQDEKNGTSKSFILDAIDPSIKSGGQKHRSKRSPTPPTPPALRRAQQKTYKMLLKLVHQPKTHTEVNSSDPEPSAEETSVKSTSTMSILNNMTVQVAAVDGEKAAIRPWTATSTNGALQSEAPLTLVSTQQPLGSACELGHVAPPVPPPPPVDACKCKSVGNLRAPANEGASYLGKWCACLTKPPFTCPNCHYTAQDTFRATDKPSSDCVCTPTKPTPPKQQPDCVCPQHLLECPNSTTRSPTPHTRRRSSNITKQLNADEIKPKSGDDCACIHRKPFKCPKQPKNSPSQPSVLLRQAPTSSKNKKEKDNRTKVPETSPTKTAPPAVLTKGTSKGTDPSVQTVNVSCMCDFDKPHDSLIHLPITGDQAIQIVTNEAQLMDYSNNSPVFVDTAQNDTIQTADSYDSPDSVDAAQNDSVHSHGSEGTHRELGIVTASDSTSNVPTRPQQQQHPPQHIQLYFDEVTKIENNKKMITRKTVLQHKHPSFVHMPHSNSSAPGSNLSIFEVDVDKQIEKLLDKTPLTDVTHSVRSPLWQRTTAVNISRSSTNDHRSLIIGDAVITANQNGEHRTLLLQISPPGTPSRRASIEARLPATSKESVSTITTTGTIEELDTATKSGGVKAVTSVVLPAPASDCGTVQCSKRKCTALPICRGHSPSGSNQGGKTDVQIMFDAPHDRTANKSSESFLFGRCKQSSLSDNSIPGLGQSVKECNRAECTTQTPPMVFDDHDSVDREMLQYLFEEKELYAKMEQMQRRSQHVRGKPTLESIRLEVAELIIRNLQEQLRLARSDGHLSKMSLSPLAVGDKRVQDTDALLRESINANGRRSPDSG